MLQIRHPRDSDIPAVLSVQTRRFPHLQGARQQQTRWFPHFLGAHFDKPAGYRTFGPFLRPKTVANDGFTKMGGRKLLQTSGL